MTVQGPGQDECSSDSQCEEEEEPYCGNGVREGSEACDGNDDSLCPANAFCSSDCRCVTETVLYCGDGIITKTLGEQCESDGQCNEDAGEICYNCRCLAPPTLDCRSKCAEIGYTSAGGSYATATACANANQPSETPICTWTCYYSHFFSTSNQAGTSTCCCTASVTGQCTSTPAGGCVCPTEQELKTSICPANEP